MKKICLYKQGSFFRKRPKEDSSLTSRKYPIFAVADGVSLNLVGDVNYPQKSGAFAVAKIFCQTVIREAEKRYKNFKKSDLKKVFQAGNLAVLKYNNLQGRTKETINYYNIDLFSATAAFVLIKKGKVFWFSICDSVVTLLDDKARELFSSPDGWIYFPKNWVEVADAREKIITRHRDYRNAVSKGTKLIGYGVVDGETSAEKYLESGTLSIKKGNIIFLYTDGFQDYVNLDKFKQAFTCWPKNLKREIKKIIDTKSKENPSKYGFEKTLIAISI